MLKRGTFCLNLFFKWKVSLFHKSPRSMLRADYKSGCVFVQETARASCRQRRRLIKRRFIKMSRNQGANKSGCRVHALNTPLTHSLAVNFIRAAWKRCSLPRYASRNARPSNIKKAILSAARAQFSAKKRPMISPEWEYLRSTLCLLRFGLKERRVSQCSFKMQKRRSHLRFCALIFSRFEESAHKYRAREPRPPLSA